MYGQTTTIVYSLILSHLVYCLCCATLSSSESSSKTTGSGNGGSHQRVNQEKPAKESSGFDKSIRYILIVSNLTMIRYALALVLVSSFHAFIYSYKLTGFQVQQISLVQLSPSNRKIKAMAQRGRLQRKMKVSDELLVLLLLRYYAHF